MKFHVLVIADFWQLLRLKASRRPTQTVRIQNSSMQKTKKKKKLHICCALSGTIDPRQASVTRTLS
jgi:hypothetical protein